MRKPKLVVRRGKGGVISSPTSSADYIAQTALVVAFASLIFWVALARDRPIVLAVGIVLCVAARDAIAWFLATAEERHEFVD